MGQNLARFRLQVPENHASRRLALSYEQQTHHKDLLLALEQRAQELINDSAPFELRVAPSTISNGGVGLYIVGKCPAGTVITLYPGCVYLWGDPVLSLSFYNPYLIQASWGHIDGSDQIIHSHLFTSLVSRDHYIANFDKTWLNVRKNVTSITNQMEGKTYEKESFFRNLNQIKFKDIQDQILEYLIEKKVKSKPSEQILIDLVNYQEKIKENKVLIPSKIEQFPKPQNQLGLGQFANHFPINKMPSLIYMCMHLPHKFPTACKSLIPNVYYNANNYQENLMSCIALVALRDVSNEELFVDYGFIGVPQDIDSL